MHDSQSPACVVLLNWITTIWHAFRGQLYGMPYFVFDLFYRTAGNILGAGFNAFISDWDKISATVSEVSSSMKIKVYFLHLKYY